MLMYCICYSNKHLFLVLQFQRVSKIIMIKQLTFAPMSSLRITVASKQCQPGAMWTEKRGLSGHLSN